MKINYNQIFSNEKFTASVLIENNNQTIFKYQIENAPVIHKKITDNKILVCDIVQSESYPDLIAIRKFNIFDNNFILKEMIVIDGNHKSTHYLDNKVL